MGKQGPDSLGASAAEGIIPSLSAVELEGRPPEFTASWDQPPVQSAPDSAVDAGAQGCRGSALEGAGYTWGYSCYMGPRRAR